MVAERLAAGASFWLRVLRLTEDTLLALLLATMVLLASGQILLRNVFEAGLLWADPVLRALVLWVGLLGALVASRENRHISIDVLSRLLPPRIREVAQAVTNVFTAGVSAVVAYHAVRFAASDYAAGTKAFAGVPSWIVESIVPFAFAVIALRYLVLFGVQVRDARRAAPR
ncbi:MAG: TRAP transporter small permease [Proteobacteria bacterium]|nr:TRAP transporter small permease [Pseudomonadota bacterium]